MLAVLQPLRSQPKLTQDQAKDALRGLKATLTEEQLTEIGTMKAPQYGSRQNGQGGQGGAQGGGPGGGGGQGGGQQGNRPRLDPVAMKDFNPFNLPENSPMARVPRAHGNAVCHVGIHRERHAPTARRRSPAPPSWRVLGAHPQPRAAATALRQDIEHLFSWERGQLVRA